MDYLHAKQLLAANRFGELLALLDGVYHQTDPDLDPVQLSLLQAACHLTQSCEHTHHQATLYSQASQEAQQSVAEQQSRLEAMFHLLIQNEQSRDTPLPVSDEVERWAPSIFKQFWRRLLNRFGPDQAKIDYPALPPYLPAYKDTLTPYLKIVDSPPTIEPELAPDSRLLPAADYVAPRPNGRRNSQVLTIYCLGHFRVFLNDKPIEKWPSSKGKCILKYMILNRQRAIPKDLLMDILWPEADAEAARNNLNVAIHGLRKALRNDQDSFSHILFEDDCYRLNPAMKLWVDVEEFGHCFAAAQKTAATGPGAGAIGEYLNAEALYLGELLVEDRYEEWILPYRQELQSNYLHILEQLCQHFFAQEEFLALDSFSRKLLAIEPCHELAHRRLMRAYCRRHHAHLALRQYHLCCQAMARELDAEPEEETHQLYEKIRQQLPI